MNSGIFEAQQRGKSADSDLRLQVKPFIYWGFLLVRGQSFTGIFTGLAARSENCYCSAIARPLLAYATDADPDTLIIGPFLAADGSDAGVVAQEGRQFERFEVMLQQEHGGFLV